MKSNIIFASPACLIFTNFLAMKTSIAFALYASTNGVPMSAASSVAVPEQTKAKSLSYKASGVFETISKSLTSP